MEFDVLMPISFALILVEKNVVKLDKPQSRRDMKNSVHLGMKLKSVSVRVT